MSENQNNIEEKALEEQPGQPQNLVDHGQGQMIDQSNQNNQYDEQEEPINYDYYDNYAEYQMEPVRTKSSVGNKQFQMKGLTKDIVKQTERINQITNLGFDWSIILFSICEWNKELCNELILSEDKKHLKLMNYNPKLTNTKILVGKGQCMICSEQNVSILRNLCGHEFCSECWANHILYRFRTQFRDAFPPCMDDRCSIKTSYSLIRQLSQTRPQIKQKFQEVLCRSYATYNKSVKICKGKPGISCNKCFKIQEMLKFIQCSTCGNFICARCGQQFHGSCQCFLLGHWKRLTQDSTQFIEQLGYKMCPHCKQVVQRKQGCNSMICQCKQEFCYVCGQKWLPNHKAHGDQTCPKFKQIQILKQQKQKQKQNKKKYFQKTQERLAKLDSLNKRFQRLQLLKRIQLKNIVQCFMKNFGFSSKSTIQAALFNYITFLQRGYCTLWGETLSLHFKDDKHKELFCKILEQNLQQINKFIIDQIQSMYKVLTKKQIDMNKKQKAMIAKQSLQKFEQDVINRIKTIHDMIPKIQKILNGIDNQSS